MRSMVVFFALAAVACGSYIPLAQPPHHPALVLDPHGRPLETSEVINARALHLQAKALDGHDYHGVHAVAAPVAHTVFQPIAHNIVTPAVVAAPVAVSHQSRVDVHSSPAVVSHSIATPVLTHTAYAPLLGHSLAGHGHLLKKRSLAHIAFSAPIIAPSAVSHQSRVDIIEKPAVVSHAITTPVIAHEVAAPVVALTHSAIAAPVSAHSILGESLWGAHSLSHGHLLKKRSLGEILAPVSYALPSAVSHQSRVDIIEKPAVVSHAVTAPVIAHTAPVAIAHAAPVAVAHIAPAAVSHQSRVDVHSSSAHLAPLTHSAVWAAPLSHWSHAGLLHAGHW